MSWDDLRILLEVSRDRSLAGAAARLGTAHTTLGRRLAALEAELSARLVRRSGRGIALTPLGEQLVERARAMEAAALDAERRSSGDDDRLAGVVRLSTTEAFAQHLLLPGLRAFQLAHPDVEVEVLIGNTQVDLARGDADLAIRAAPSRTPSLVTRRLALLGVGLYGSAEYLRRRHAFENEGEGHEVIGYSDEARGFPEARWLASHAKYALTRLRLASVLAIAAAVRAGLGLGLLPCYLVQHDTRLRRVAPLDPALQRPVAVVADRRVYRSARVRALAEHIERSLVARRRELLGS